MIAWHDRDDRHHGPPDRFTRPVAARHGYTLAEALVVAGLIAVLALLLLPVLSQARRTSRAVACLSNLRNLSSAFHQYSQDNGNHLPFPAVTQIPWERSLFKYVTPGTFICPADEELAPATRSSYDWRDTGVTATTLAGYGLDSTRRSNALLVFDALPCWHQSGQMNVALLDGSVHSMDQGEAVTDLETPVRPP